MPTWQGEEFLERALAHFAELGLEPVQMVLLLMSVVVSVLTVVPGRAKPLQGGLHMVLLAGVIETRVQQRLVERLDHVQ